MNKSNNRKGGKKPQFISKYRNTLENNLPSHSVRIKRSVETNKCESSDTDSDDFLKLVSNRSSKKGKPLSAFSSSDSDTDVVPCKKEKSIGSSENFVDSRDASDVEFILSGSDLEDENDVRKMFYFILFC